MKNDWVVVGKLKRAKNRINVLRIMPKDKPFLPSELVVMIYGKNSSTYFTIISRALRELDKLKLVNVLNEKERVGRLYKITKKGKNILKFV
ncbi:MAG: hypothetical protein QT11_C0001G0990 [archaeon GW2011_AR20]|nr:MAG: hypothetical protein QT11_C0001G0990 [archaeon GW2011_AR20]MBS3161040.1 hypothetical protein [Candidatus Woesearchaeota archaeon]